GDGDSPEVRLERYSSARPLASTPKSSGFRPAPVPPHRVPGPMARQPLVGARHCFQLIRTMDRATKARSVRRRWRHSRKAGGGSKFSAVPSRERGIRRGNTMDATPAIPHHRCAVPVMRKLLLGSIAALFLATGTAHADNEKWEASFRQCHIRKWFSKDEL